MCDEPSESYTVTTVENAAALAKSEYLVEAAVSGSSVVAGMPAAPTTLCAEVASKFPAAVTVVVFTLFCEALFTLRSSRAPEPPEGKPCTYKHAFLLLQKLGCYTVFMPLPETIKSSAFFSEIHGHRVVFVNRKSNVLDLVFFLLHESVHAAFDEEKEISAELEAFCDAVAGAIQFPVEYIQLVKELLKPLEPAQQKGLVKKLAQEHGHATYGLTKQLFPSDKARHQAAAKTDNSLRKKYPSLDELFFNNGESALFLSLYHQLSPQYLGLIASVSANLSPRRVGELMGLESELDASLVKEELAQYMES